MESDQFLLSASAIFSILLLAAFMRSLCKRIRVPFAVGLLFLGMGLSYINAIFPIPFLVGVDFSPEIVFYVFLPTLIFESAYHLNYRQFQGLFREITMLAVFGLLVATGVTAALMHYLVGLPWEVAFLFGAFISATDPVAVLAIFKEMKAPKRLSTIVDGESLINDAAALVFFQFFLKVALAASFVFSVETFLVEIEHVFLSVFNGVLVGLVFGVLFARAIAQTNDRGVKVTLSLVLAHATFILAEGVLHHLYHIPASGILATMTAGIVMGNYGARRLSQQEHRSFQDIWHFLGFVSNGLIFVLLGLKIGTLDLWAYKEMLVVAIVVTLLISRPVAVFLSFFLTNLTRKKCQKVVFSDQLVTFWGGMRGALAATAVLLIPESYAYAELLQVLTGGVIVASFLLNAMTIGPLMKWLKLVDFTSHERLQRYEAEIIIDEKVSLYLDELLDKKYIPRFAYDRLKLDYLDRKKLAEADLDLWRKKHAQNDRETEKILLRFALGIERSVYKKLLDRREISDDRFLVFMQSVQRQSDSLDEDVLPEERLKKGPKTAPIVPGSFDDVGRGRDFPFGFSVIFRRVFQWRKKRKILSRLLHYRARLIASWKVVREMETLMDNQLFADSLIVQRIIDRYREWYCNAEEKMRDLERRYPCVLEDVRFRMAENACIEKARYWERDFYDKGFLCEKVFAQMWAQAGRK